MADEALPELELADNLRSISGIGPAIEHRLNKGGIRTFAELAMRSPEEIAVLLNDVAGMSAARVSQLDWIGRARTLVQQAPPLEPSQRPMATGNRQHYATFTVELLLEEDNKVRRTRVMHIQDGVEDTWAGWAEPRLIDFIAQHAALRLATPEAAPPLGTESLPTDLVMAAPIPSPALATQVGGLLSLQELEVVTSEAAASSNFLPHGQPFTLRLTLDLSKVAAPAGSSLDYTATVYAKVLGGQRGHILGEEHGALTLTDKVTIEMAGSPLQPGTYRLEAVVALTRPSAEPGLMAHLEGGLLQVY